MPRVLRLWDELADVDRFGQPCVASTKSTIRGSHNTTRFARSPVLIVGGRAEPSTSTAFNELLSTGFHC